MTQNLQYGIYSDNNCWRFHLIIFGYEVLKFSIVLIIIQTTLPWCPADVHRSSPSKGRGESQTRNHSATVDRALVAAYILLGYCLPYSSTLKVEVVRSSETSVNLQLTARLSSEKGLDLLSLLLMTVSDRHEALRSLSFTAAWGYWSVSIDPIIVSVVIGITNGHTAC